MKNLHVMKMSNKPALLYDVMYRVSGTSKTPLQTMSCCERGRVAVNASGDLRSRDASNDEERGVCVHDAQRQVYA